MQFESSFLFLCLDIDAAVASLEDENKTPEASGMLFVSNHFEDSAESVSENEELQKGLRYKDLVLSNYIMLNKGFNGGFIHIMTMIIIHSQMWLPLERFL